MVKVTEKSGVNFTIHDLRRTFITIAESLDIPAYALKRLLNHKMNHDVTSGYIITDVERLREPMQRITNYLLSKCQNNTSPFEPLVPNAKTIDAMKEARRSKLASFFNVQTLMKDLKDASA